MLASLYLYKRSSSPSQRLDYVGVLVVRGNLIKASRWTGSRNLHISNLDLVCLKKDTYTTF